MVYYVVGSIWFLVTAGWAIIDQEKRKNEDGSYAPMTALSIISGVLFLGPYVIGVFHGFKTMAFISLFPPFAMHAFLQLMFG